MDKWCERRERSIKPNNDTFAMHSHTHTDTHTICLHVMCRFVCIQIHTLYAFIFNLNMHSFNSRTLSHIMYIVQFSCDARRCITNEIENALEIQTHTHTARIFNYILNAVFRRERSLHCNGPFKWLAYQ